MPFFKARRDLALFGICVVLFLYLWMTPREADIIYQELEEDKDLFSGHDDRVGYARYRIDGQAERVASDIYVNWDRRLAKETEILSHVPGFTIIRSLLVTNGTYFVVSDRPKQLPGLQLMLSAWNDVHSEHPSSTIPSQKEIRVISRKTARQLMGTSASRVAGTTWIYNDPYAYVDDSWPLAFLRTHYMQDHRSTNNATLLPPRRLVFPQIHSEKHWHNPALWSLPHLLFPELGVLYTEDWKDYAYSRRPFLLEHVVLVDRGAAARNPRMQSSLGSVGWRGWKIGSKTDKLNLQLGTPFDSFRDIGGLWWDQWRHLLAENADLEAHGEGNETRKTVITLLQDCNSQRGRLTPDSDAKLRAELVTLKLEEGYEINYVKWNQTSFIDRLQLALRTTIFLGAAGSLTEATWMTVAPHSAVMEFFPDHYFSKRIQGIAKAIGVHYFAWQGSKSYVTPHFPSITSLKRSSRTPSKHLDTESNLQPTAHEHGSRDLIEPREDDPIHVDGKAVVNAIRKWVREHQPADSNLP